MCNSISFVGCSLTQHTFASLLSCYIYENCKPICPAVCRASIRLHSLCHWGTLAAISNVSCLYIDSPLPLPLTSHGMSERTKSASELWKRPKENRGRRTQNRRRSNRRRSTNRMQQGCCSWQRTATLLVAGEWITVNVAWLSGSATGSGSDSGLSPAISAWGG